MRNYLSVIILTVVLFVVGCDKGDMLPIKIERGMTLLKIERRLAGRANPSLTVLAKKVSLDYKERIIVVEGLMNITGNWGGYVDWVVPEMIIRDNNILISIPTDADYKIQIGETRFYLPFIKK